MTDYIKTIADILITGKKLVALYGAGADAIFMILRLQSQYSVIPTCVCDSDSSKYHKKLQNVEILSLDEALACYPDLCLFISSRTYKHEIIGNLLEGGKISKDRILNYEPVERRLSCRYLDNDIVVLNHCLNFCCSDFGKNRSPSVEFNGDYELAASDFAALRDRLIDDISRGNPTQCDGCTSIRTGYYSAERKIRLFNYGEIGVCNFNCAYCTSLAKHKMKIDENEVDCRKMLNAFERLGLTAEDCRVDIAPGEITVHPKRSEIYDAAEDRTDIILTNASVYDERLAGILKHRGRFYISVDAGTRETFAKIKGADLFDRVRSNLKRYAEAAGFAPYEIKYIFMPGVNDNEADVDGFAEFCRDIGTHHILISYDFYAPDPNETTVSAIKRLMGKLDSEKMQYHVISDVIQRTIAV
jgi:pyruvate-formate lyase-activating enzyme